MYSVLLHKMYIVQRTVQLLYTMYGHYSVLLYTMYSVLLHNVHNVHCVLQWIVQCKPRTNMSIKSYLEQKILVTLKRFTMPQRNDLYNLPVNS